MPSSRTIAAAVTTVALSAGSVLSLSATASAATVASPVVTPKTALAATNAVAKVLSKAGTTYDKRLQDTVDAGASQVADDGDFRVSQKVGYEAYRPFTWVGTTVYVPRQTHYPATFLALTHYKSAGSATSKDPVALVFVKASSKARWHVVAAVGLTATSVPRFSVGKDGFLPTLATSTLMVTPTAMYPALLKAQTLAARGAKPSAAWAYNSVWKKYLSQTRTEAIDTHETFTSTHHAPLCFASTVGAFCLTSSTEVRLQTSTAAELAAGLYWTVSSQEQQYDAGGIPLGSYATIRTVAQRQLTVVIPRKKKGAKLVVTAEYWSPLSGVGTLPPAPTAPAVRG
jgi:hypothetical protein